MIPFKKILFIISIFLLMSCQKENLTPVFRELNHKWKFKQSDSDIWLPATIPGNVHTDLYTNFLIKDPFYGTNEKDLQWIETKDWEYETRFDLSKKILEKENIEIIFEGLDTYAKVILNNHLILLSDNMFIQHTIDCKPFLTERENELKITFISPVNEAEIYWNEYPYELPGGQKVMTRKAGFHYGWDWGPRIVTSGIWRPIVIHAWNSAKIEDVQIIRNYLSEDNADFEALVEIQSNENINIELQLSVSNLINRSLEFNLEKGTHKYRLPFKINDPKLWWTNGLGEAFLYKLNFKLIQNNQIIDENEMNYGIRTIELIQDKDEFGESFYFKLNGKPIFIKGANYIPQDNFQNSVSDERYKRLFETVVNSNMNMLRVWGGGIYEDDIFYDLCDENGILVWQDFMFACALYPSNKEFLDNVNTEVIQTVKRLRNHPCIALWCGNNEIDEAWHNWGWSKAFSKEDSTIIRKGYNKLFHDIIPNTVKTYDPERLYHPSSPKYGRGNDLSLFEGDSHYWGVWHDAEPFENYEEKVPRFMSEFGFQSFPSLKTIKKFTDTKDLYIDSEIMLSHQKHPRGNALIKQYMNDYYSIPEDFEHFVYVSQLMQAEGIILGIEAHRRAKPYCGGTLYWQLNDCWPVISWSSIDYYGNRKALQYFVKKAYEKYLISITKKNDNLEVYIISDDLNKTDAELCLILKNFKGDTLWSFTEQFEIRANKSKVYYTNKLSNIIKDQIKNDLVLQAQLKRKDSVIAETFKYFVKPKNLNLQKVDVKYSIHKIENAYELDLISENLAKNVYLETDLTGFFSDNYFDLPAGCKKKIIFYTEDQFLNSNNIRIITYNDVFLKN